jgi:predicted HAD superfamily Cof-like phosphohydrolase
MSINNEYNMVKEFHKTFGHPVADKPTLMNLPRACSRYKWMKEEIDEFLEATEKGDIYEQADALLDNIYFALGTLVEMGIPPAELFAIVQKANMSKLWEDGTVHMNEIGKVIKPEGWQDPHDKLVEVIDRITWEAICGE